MKRFRCGDVIPGCDQVLVGDDEEALLSAVAAHAARDHGLPALDPQALDAVRDATVTT